jgi:hypothetical protein
MEIASPRQIELVAVTTDLDRRDTSAPSPRTSTSRDHADAAYVAVSAHRGASSDST